MLRLENLAAQSAHLDLNSNAIASVKAAGNPDYSVGHWQPYQQRGARLSEQTAE